MQVAGSALPLGLHSFSRRVWVKKGVRPVCPGQQRYPWGYLYGAVGIGLARSEFFHAETVDQEHLAACSGQIGPLCGVAQAAIRRPCTSSSRTGPASIGVRGTRCGPPTCAS